MRVVLVLLAAFSAIALGQTTGGIDFGVLSSIAAAANNNVPTDPNASLSAFNTMLNNAVAAQVPDGQTIQELCNFLNSNGFASVPEQPVIDAVAGAINSMAVVKDSAVQGLFDSTQTYVAAQLVNQLNLQGNVVDANKAQALFDTLNQTPTVNTPPVTQAGVNNVQNILSGFASGVDSGLAKAIAKSVPPVSCRDMGGNVYCGDPTTAQAMYQYVSTLGLGPPGDDLNGQSYNVTVVGSSVVWTYIGQDTLSSSSTSSSLNVTGTVLLVVGLIALVVAVGLFAASSLKARAQR
jgi:hypothetical protein